LTVVRVAAAVVVVLVVVFVFLVVVGVVVVVVQGVVVVVVVDVVPVVVQGVVVVVVVDVVGVVVTFFVVVVVDHVDVELVVAFVGKAVTLLAKATIARRALSCMSAGVDEQRVLSNSVRTSGLERSMRISVSWVDGDEIEEEPVALLYASSFLTKAPTEQVGDRFHFADGN